MFELSSKFMGGFFVRLAGVRAANVAKRAARHFPYLFQEV